MQKDTTSELLQDIAQKVQAFYEEHKRDPTQEEADIVVRGSRIEEGPPRICVKTVQVQREAEVTERKVEAKTIIPPFKEPPCGMQKAPSGGMVQGPIMVKEIPRGKAHVPMLTITEEEPTAQARPKGPPPKQGTQKKGIEYDVPPKASEERKPKPPPDQAVPIPKMTPKEGFPKSKGEGRGNSGLSQAPTTMEKHG